VKFSALLLLVGGLFTSALGQQFDVASIKLAPPMDASHGRLSVGPRGGPGTDDPARYTCSFCTVAELVSQAYNLPEYRVIASKHLPDDRFHIAANVPAGATRDEFRAMLQNLLEDRFGLRAHRELRDMQTFRLIRSPGASKLTPHIEGTPPAEAKADTKNRAPGFYYRVQARSIADFARVIEGQLQKPVTDATGLTGRYDFDVYWSFDQLENEPSSPTAPPTLLSAVRSLGLRLESHKGQVQVVVVDDVQKVPTEN
jgi:uncharacterized protein (TIGR03435 family)